MPEYIVYVKEVWVQPYRVKARTPDEVLWKIKSRHPDANIISDGFEYSHELDSEYWEIKEIKPDEG